MLDDDACGFVKSLDAFPRCISVGNIVVRQFLALQLLVIGQSAFDMPGVAVKRCRLVRILTVTHFLYFFEMQVQCRRIGAAGFVLLVFTQRSEVIGDRAVILGGMRKHLLGQRKFGAVTDFTLIRLQLSQHTGVIARIAQHDHIFMILG